MNENHRHEYEDITRLEQAIRDKQPTGNHTIDRLVSTVPRPDAGRRVALEAYLVAQLSPESEQKESEYMDMPVEMKRKNKPKPRRRGRNIGIAAFVSIGLTMITLAGLFLSPRSTIQQFGFGYITPEKTRELHSALLIATRLSAEATRDAGTASAINIIEGDGMQLTATAIIRDATLAQIAPTLTAIEEDNALQASLGEDQKTATALIQEVTQVYVDQTATAEVVFFNPLNATATAEAIFAGNQMTATAIIRQVTQVVLDATTTAQMILDSPMQLATPTLDEMFASPVQLGTPTPEPNLSIAPQTIHIPLIRMVVYDDRTQSVFVEGQRLLLFTELRYTSYEWGPPPENEDDLDVVETPLLSSTARIVRIHQGPVGPVPLATIEVQVDASEYAVLKWFVENTTLQFLFIASPIVTVP